MANATVTQEPATAVPGNVPESQKGGTTLPGVERGQMLAQHRSNAPIIGMLERLGGPNKTPMTSTTRPVEDHARLDDVAVTQVAYDIEALVNKRSLSERDIVLIAQTLLRELPSDRTRILNSVAGDYPNGLPGFLGRLKALGGQQHPGVLLIENITKPDAKPEEIVRMGLDWAIAKNDPAIAMEVLALRGKDEMQALAKKIPDLEAKMTKALEKTTKAAYLVPCYMSGATEEEINLGFDGIGEAFRLVRGVTYGNARQKEEAFRIMDLVRSDPAAQQTLMDILNERSKQLAAWKDPTNGPVTRVVLDVVNWIRADKDASEIVKDMSTGDISNAVAKRIHLAIEINAKDPSLETHELAKKMVESALEAGSEVDWRAAYLIQYPEKDVKDAQDLLKKLVALDLYKQPQDEQPKSNKQQDGQSKGKE